jgi:elongation factor G
LKSLEAKKKGDEDKIGQALLRISEEDPTLHIEKDRDSGEILIRGYWRAAARCDDRKD